MKEKKSDTTEPKTTSKPTTDQQQPFDTLLDRLPSIIWRARWPQLAKDHGLPYSRGYLENLDSAGLGPKKIALGPHGRVGYRREDLVEWLNQRAGGNNQ